MQSIPLCCSTSIWVDSRHRGQDFNVLYAPSRSILSCLAWRLNKSGITCIAVDIHMYHMCISNINMITFQMMKMLYSMIIIILWIVCYLFIYFSSILILSNGVHVYVNCTQVQFPVRVKELMEETVLNIGGVGNQKEGRIIDTSDTDHLQGLGSTLIATR